MFWLVLVGSGWFWLVLVGSGFPHYIAPTKFAVFRISAARCLSAASSRQPEKQWIFWDESDIWVPFFGSFFGHTKNEHPLCVN